MSKRIDEIKYANPVAASNALAELKATYQLCRQAGGGMSPVGQFTPYSFYDVVETPEALVKESRRLIVRASYGFAEGERQLLAVYQFRGSFFTGLYIVKTGAEKMSDGEVKRWLDVAAALANRL